MSSTHPRAPRRRGSLKTLGRPPCRQTPGTTHAPPGSRGAIIYDIRCLLGLTQEQLATRMGMHQESICRYKMGTRPVPDSTFFLAVSLLTPDQKAALVAEHTMQAKEKSKHRKAAAPSP